MQLGLQVRNAIAEAIESSIGPAPLLEIRTTVPPANCAASDTGVVIWSIVLPADWLQAAASGSKSQNGIWSGGAGNPGVPGHWRLRVNTVAGAVLAQGPASELNLSTGTNAIVAQQAILITGTTFGVGNS